jgi:hypothetical protein
MGGPSLSLLTVVPTKNQNIHEVLEGCEVLQGSTLADLSSPYLNRGLISCQRLEFPVWLKVAKIAK